MRHPQTDSTPWVPPASRLTVARTTAARPAKTSSSASSTPASGRSTRASPTTAPTRTAARSTTERSACDFGNTAQNADDAPFTCNNKLIGARQMLDTYRAIIGAEPDEFDSARDDDGHGTHTASTAAGNAGVQASVFGVNVAARSPASPRAPTIVAYKALGNLGGFTSDLAAAIDQAVADGVDVINYSIGGGASLSAPTTLAFLFAADAGVFVATSAGNDGPGAGHDRRPRRRAVGDRGRREHAEPLLPGHRRARATAQAYTGASITGGTGARARSSTPPTPAATGADLCLRHARPGQGHRQDRRSAARRQRPRREEPRGVQRPAASGMVLYNTDRRRQPVHRQPLASRPCTSTRRRDCAIKAYIALDGADPTATHQGTGDDRRRAPTRRR